MFVQLGRHRSLRKSVKKIKAKKISKNRKTQYETHTKNPPRIDASRARVHFLKNIPFLKTGTARGRGDNARQLHLTKIMHLPISHIKKILYSKKSHNKTGEYAQTVHWGKKRKESSQ